MNIVLVGFMGTGKTVVARRLSEILNKKYISLDDMIQEKESKSINDIFSQNGEPYFRKLEKDATKEASLLDGVVIDAGGGIVKDDENIKNLGRNGKIICLNAAPAVIYQRIKDQPHRPLLNVDDPMTRIKELLYERKEFYKKAHYTIDTSELSIDEVVERIIDLAKK